MQDIGFELQTQGMMIHLPSGPAYFNYYWLKDACTSCIDPQTRERVSDIAALPAPPVARAAKVDGDHIVIDWQNDPVQSTVPLSLIRQLAEDGRAEDPAALPRRRWLADFNPHICRVSHQGVLHNAETRAVFARALIEEGIAIVHGMAPDQNSLPQLVNTIGPILPSAEGNFFDVRVEIEPTNLAFTAGPLEMHTDLPGEEHAPGVQFLHCLENSVEGGLSLFLDGVAVAEDLKAEDPDAFALLATHEIPFFYRHTNVDYRAHQRVIETDAQGDVTGVTISQHLQDTMDLPQKLLDRYYPAFVKFLNMMQQDKYVMRFRSEAGSCVVFDNHRVVHGREGYVADSGRRHLRGCYTDRGALYSTYRVLAKQGYDGIPVKSALSV